jgi:two-component system, cell cycle sensor histidine kinase and response regulator CckA
MNFKDIVDPDYLKMVEENLRKKIQNGIETTGPYEVLMRPKDGAPLWIEVTSRVITKDGKPVAVHGTARDVTERKRLEERLLQAAKMEAVGTLAGGLSHDFNNLLQIVLGYADLIVMDKEKQEKDYQRARIIHDAAMRGRDLVNRILTFSRRVETKPRPIDLNNELNQMDNLLRSTIPKMIAIELRLADNLPPISADPTQIEQILLNLAVNATHAMPEGGRLVFETENVRLDEEYCRTHLETKPGEYVLLTVSDTGHGMEKEILDRIFEPFFTTKDRGEGTGLGLSMVFGIVKSHDGHITCHSKPDAGTVFKLYFPAVEMKIAWDPEITMQMPSFGTETILLVDDEQSIRDLGKEVLTSVGYKVITAGTGREALDTYFRAQDEISLVILDLIMPEMGGKQCIEELLKINPALKILIASGYAADVSTEESLASGATGYVSKPYNMKQLLRAVRHALDVD